MRLIFIFRILVAGTPAFSRQEQLGGGLGSGRHNYLYFLFCDWKTSWNLLFRPIDEKEEKEIDEIVKVRKEREFWVLIGFRNATRKK